MIIVSLEVYLDEDSLFSRIDLKELNAAKLEMEAEAKKTAIENNLLKAAQKIINAMLKSDSKPKNYKVPYKYTD